MFNKKKYRQYLPVALSIVSLALLALVGFFGSEKWLGKQAEKVQPKVVLAESLGETASSKEKKTANSSSPKEKKSEETTTETSSEASVSETPEAVTETVASHTDAPSGEVTTEIATQYVEAVAVDNTINYAYDTTSYATSNVISNGAPLANGNTAGEIGSYAAAQMAAATGVAQETWEYIIARESNGDPSAANASGASGLFQTIPGWGSTATVEDQIQSALNAYNSQGLAAWGY